MSAKRRRRRTTKKRMPLELAVAVSFLLFLVINEKKEKRAKKYVPTRHRVQKEREETRWRPTNTTTRLELMFVSYEFYLMC